MKPTLLTTAILCCALGTFSPSSLLARGGNDGPKNNNAGENKGGGGGGRPAGGHQGGGGGRPAGGHQGGGGNAHKAGQGGTPGGGGKGHSGGGSPNNSGAVHHNNHGAGSAQHHQGGQHQAGKPPAGQNQAGKQPGGQHQPGQHHGGQNQAGKQPGGQHQPGQHHQGGQPQVNNRPGSNPGNVGSPQVGKLPGMGNGGHSNSNHSSHVNGNHQHKGPAGGNQGGVGTLPAAQHHNPHNNPHKGSHHQGGIGQQHFAGNSVNFGNRHINIGSAGYRPAYYRHSNNYHGHWNGNRGYGGYVAGPGHIHAHGRHGYRPYFWGLGGWGLGSLIYGSGYMGYSNPYYVSAGPNVVYNYAQPIPVSYDTPAVTDPNANFTSPAEAIMNSAVDAFKQNNYDAALDIVNRGIGQHPDDSVLHEFRALVLFAKGDYQQAAATAHSVLAVGPGWDWATLSGLYVDVGIYTAQLRALEAVVKQNPNDGATRFLLAYHYLSEGYPDAAVTQLQKVVVLVPNDVVAANLLKMTTSPEVSQPTDSTAQPVPQPPVDIPAPGQTTATPVDPAMIVGDWKASRGDGSNFTLTLTGEKTFSWSFSPKQQPAQSFDGTYSLEGNVLALERTGGGSLVAEITSNDGMQFNFKMVGAPDTDPGLTFVR